MTTKYTIAEKNCTTGEEIIREMTAEEIKIHEENVARLTEKFAAREAEEARIAALKESARAKLIAGEPLTAEEAATIVL